VSPFLLPAFLDESLDLYPGNVQEPEDVTCGGATCVGATGFCVVAPPDEDGLGATLCRMAVLDGAGDAAGVARGVVMGVAAAGA
jgi:hypothetical protein